MTDKSKEYVTIDDVLDLSCCKSIGEIIAEELDRMIMQDIIEVFKKYFPNTTINEERVLKLARMLIAEEKGGE